MGMLLGKSFSGKSLSLSELARRCGVSKSYLSMVTNGKRRSVSREVLEKLAKELDTSPSELEELITRGVKWFPTSAEDSDDVGADESFSKILEAALNAWLDHDLSALTRISGIIARMDESKVRLRKTSYGGTLL